MHPKNSAPAGPAAGLYRFFIPGVYPVNPRDVIDDPKSTANPAEVSRFFQSADWGGFWLASFLSFLVYQLTLAPDITLEYSGVYSTSAMYPGPSIPPGHALWVIYGWLFIKLIPISNLAWRLNLSSAVAGALTCGMIALLASRIGRLAVERISDLKDFSAKGQKRVQLVCGCVAGLGFGFDGCFWCKAVVVDTWPLSLCLLAVTICFLTRWFFAPQQKGYLYAAACACGLTLSESQALIPAAFGLPFLLTAGNRGLGREIFFGISIFLWSLLLFKERQPEIGWSVQGPDEWILAGAAGLATLMWGIQSFRTSSFFSEWKTTAICGILFCAGISACFLLPIFSMTNPPVNWAYPRTVQGFFHTLSRGQFESLYPTASFSQFGAQWKIYLQITATDLGVFYLLAAAVPFFCSRTIPLPARRWLFGLLTVWLVMTSLMLGALNLDPLAAVLVKPYFAASHLILAVFSGCGLMLVATFSARRAGTISPG